MDATRRVVVGRIGAPVGLRGAVRVWSYTVPPEALLDYRTLQAGSVPNGRVMQVQAGEIRGRSLVLQFAGVTDRDAAARLNGTDLAVERRQLPPLPDGEFYWADLEGLAVVTLDGQALGTVATLMETGANDVLVVRDGPRERLIPYLRDSVVRQVDLPGGTLTVDWDAEF